VEAVYNIGISSQICKIFVAHYLPPVTQLSATPFQNTCYLSWNKPAGPSGDPSGLIGYNIYRNGTMVHYIPHKDTTHFNDVGLLPGTYSYEVRARYDLSVFGWTGQFGEALSPGSVPVFIAGSLHFMPVWMGVPINPMSIVVHQALCTGTSLGTGDEIGVFDGTVCVGMVKLVSAINPSHPPVITVSEDNPATPAIDGYIAGDSILCKIWRVIPPGEFSNVSYTFPYAPLYAQGHFQINDTSVVSLFTFNVPPALQVSDTTVTSGQTTCFNATGHLTVAGNGSLFKVLPGGSATMIAGLKISYFPGTKVFSGGYMHGYISPDGLYCGGMPPFAPITPEEKDLRVSENSGDFILYPNPASDKLFVKSIRPSATGAIAMEIFNVVGKRMIRITLQDPASTFVDIALFPPGLYLAVIRSDGGRQIGRFVISGR
jgi:hypothetical protein